MCISNFFLCFRSEGISRRFREVGLSAKKSHVEGDTMTIKWMSKGQTECWTALKITTDAKVFGSVGEFTKCGGEALLEKKLAAVLKRSFITR